MHKTEIDVEVLSLEDVLSDLTLESTLFLFNDDVNTFDYVIDCLIEVCDHEHAQAEQCAFIVHHKGKCDIKNGTLEDLLPAKNELNRRGLSVAIQ